MDPNQAQSSNAYGLIEAFAAGSGYVSNYEEICNAVQSDQIKKEFLAVSYVRRKELYRSVIYSESYFREIGADLCKAFDEDTFFWLWSHRRQCSPIEALPPYGSYPGGSSYQWANRAADYAPTIAEEKLIERFARDQNALDQFLERIKVAKEQLDI